MINQEYINQKVQENVKLELYKQTDEYKNELIKNKVDKDKIKNIKKRLIISATISIISFIIGCVFILVNLKLLAFLSIFIIIFSFVKTIDYYADFDCAKFEIEKEEFEKNHQGLTIYRW